MEKLELIFDMSLALGTALVFGAIAYRLRQPVVLGYLGAGLLVGPHTPGISIHPERVQALAELGVILLLFGLGVQFSLAELRRVRNVAVYGGIIQILSTMALGFLIARTMDYDLLLSVFFGALIALSSTVVVLKVLIDRGELDATHGRIMIGICLVQDLCVVPMMVILPALASPLEELGVRLGLAVAEAALVLVATLVIGTRLVPVVLGWVASTRSRELFLITIVFLCLGTAAAVSLTGLSLALGAFLAGLVVSESQYSHQTLADVLPLRDLFAVLFFVSIGMLVDPAFLLANPAQLAVVVAAILLGKFLIVALVCRGFGYSAATAVFAGLGLLQVGEFSFVLARIGEEAGVVTEEVFSLILGGALVTMVATPLAMQMGRPLLALPRRLPFGSRLLARPMEAHFDPHATELVGHAVILGYGEVGRMLSNVLRTRGLPHLVIDHDPHAIRTAREEGVPCIYGDAANGHVLAQTNLTRARLLAVTLPDPIAAELAITNGRRINPRLDVVARAPTASALRLLRESGAREVVNPSVEVSLEMTRHALHRFGVSSIEALAVVNRLRDEYHREIEE